MAGEDAFQEGWQVLKLGDLGKIVTGKTPSTKIADNFGGHIPFITPSDMDGRRIIAHTGRYLTEQGAASVSSARIPKSTVMVSCIGSDMGKAAIAGCDAVTNQQINSIIVGEGISNLYVYYNLSTRKSGIQHIGSGGSAVPILNKGHFSQLRIALPPFAEQQAIAHILGTLDDKIELNRRMNQTLEGIAQAIFKSWFVDFDPVRAKLALSNDEGATGQQPPGLAPHIAGLFPDAFEESELGEIPKGWHVDTILTVSELLSGGTPSTKVPEYWDGNISWVSAKDVRAAQGMFLLDTERAITQAGVNNSSTKILPELTTIVTARGTVGSYCILAEPMAMNQTNYGLQARHEHTDYFVFFALGNLVSQLKQRAYGTIFDTVTTRTFETSQIVVPGHAVIEEFDQHVRPLMEKVRQNLRQSRTLAALRDTLLPRLISGELRVPEMERVPQERAHCESQN